MAFLARTYGHAPGMGAAAAGGFPGLSPQTLAFIQGLKQQQQEAQVGQQRHEERMEMLRRQFGMQEEDSRFKRYQYEREAGDRTADRDESKKMAQAKMRMDLVGPVREFIKQTMRDPSLSPQEKAEAIGEARRDLAADLRQFGATEEDVRMSVGPDEPVRDLIQRAQRTPQSYDPEATRAEAEKAGGVPTAEGAVSALRQMDPKADPRQALGVYEQAFGVGGAKAGELDYEAGYMPGAKRGVTLKLNPRRFKGPQRAAFLAEEIDRLRTQQRAKPWWMRFGDWASETMPPEVLGDFSHWRGGESQL